LKLILAACCIFLLQISEASASLIVTKTDTASSAMTAAAHPEAAKAGIEILQNGGNAVDAAAAMAFVIGVVEPHASGLGGGGGMLIYLEKDSSLNYIDYYMQSSQNADTAFSSKEDLFTPRSVCIPGTAAGLISAVKKYGRLPLAEVIEPAVQLARDGFVISEKFYAGILDKLEVITLHQETQNLFFKDDFPLAEGDTLKNLQLADVLVNLSEQGEDYFYRGAFAEKAAQDIKSSGGYISKEDFAAYRPVFKKPVSISYKDFQIYSAPAPQSGTTLLEILNIFENVPQKDGCFADNPSLIHYFCEAVLRADADRYKYIGDPSVFDIPMEGLLNEAFALQRFKDIEADKIKYAFDEYVPAGRLPNLIIEQDSRKKPPHDGTHTTHISVVDADGNAVSLTQTLGLYFGSGFSSQGVIFNSAMSVFYEKPSPNHIGPRRRPMTTISPTMIMENNKLRAVIGTPGGGRIFNVLAQIIVRLLDFNFSAKEAVAAPRFNIRLSSKKLNMEGRFPEASLTALAKMGYNLDIREKFSSYFGGVQLIVYDETLNKYIGISDMRRDGGALGY